MEHSGPLHQSVAIFDALEVAAWTPPTVYATHGIAHGRSTATIDQTLLTDLLPGPLHQGWWARLLPGGFVVPHCDVPPFRERWHFPVRPAGFFWEDGAFYEPVEPFIVRHWLPHAVWNPTDRPRIHLMVEREILSYEGSQKSFTFESMLWEIQELIDALEHV